MMNDMLFNDICKAISSIRVTYVGMEYDLQAIVAATLKGAGVPFQKEYKLGHGNRVDFFADGVVIEIKKGKPNRTRVMEQIRRYAGFKCVEAVVVVVQSSLQVAIEEVSGKPCKIIGLQKLWGIAL